MPEETNLSYGNARQMVSYLASSIKTSTKWAEFEPIGEPLYSRMRQEVTTFLTDQWRQGALKGSTADEAFSVTCDGSNNTHATIDGEVNVDIGVAPTSPAEFVHFQISQTAGQARKG